MLDPSEYQAFDWVPPRPTLVVVVDTEAEFDWVHNRSRKATGVTSVKAQQRAHRVFDRFGVKPTYVLDYPVSTIPDGYRPIRELLDAGVCEIGAHLQPWDTPPFAETISDANSFPGNLPPELERLKLQELTAVIETNLGVRPLIYKAGRYGVGKATAATLVALGYKVDVSVLPHTDLTAHDGPDFSQCSARPFWCGPGSALLEVPMSIGFTGGLARFGVGLNRWVVRPCVHRLHIPGILARLHLFDRVTLTPEGVTFAEQRRLTRAMLATGHHFFSLTYHSPSMVPGHTPYVRSDKDLQEFLRRIEQFLEFFMGDEVGGVAATPLEVRELARAAAGRH